MNKLFFSSLLLTACLPPLPPGGTDTSGTTNPTTGMDPTNPTTVADSTGMDPTTGDPTGADSTGMEPELCTYHCFSATPTSFPYSLHPVDQDGAPVVVPLSCNLVGGGTLDLLGTSFPIDESQCAANQESAEEVHAIGVCAPGVVPEPPSAIWINWANTYADAQQRRCVDVLVEMGCLPSPPLPQFGAEELCNAYLRNHLIPSVIAVSPQFEEVDPLVETSIPGDPCDYVDNLECG